MVAGWTLSLAAARNAALGCLPSSLAFLKVLDGTYRFSMMDNSLDCTGKGSSMAKKRNRQTSIAESGASGEVAIRAAVPCGTARNCGLDARQRRMMAGLWDWAKESLDFDVVLSRPITKQLR